MIEFGNFYQLIAKTTYPTGWKPCLRKLPRQRISSMVC